MTDRFDAGAEDVVGACCTGRDGMDAVPEGLLSASLRSGLLSLRLPVAAQTADVWRWLTRPRLLAEWSPVVPDRELTTPGPASARETAASNPVDATVIEAFEPFRLVHRWGPDTLTWQLAPSGETTHLQLVHDLADRERYAEMAAGWHLCLGVLADRLAGGDSPRVVGPDALAAGWDRLRAAYLAAIVPNDADD